tara:strand:+ start:89 stop:1810 length:1722 start_codon:yes stop_codon:yes gene_type:complete
MNEEEDIRGGATDEQINQAYKEAKINEQRDPRTDEKFLEKRAKENKIKGFDSSESMLDEEFEAQKELQEDDQTAEQQFKEANIGFDIMYEIGKKADSILGSGGALGELFDFLKGKSEGKDVEFPVQLLLKEQKDLPKDPTKALIPPVSQTNAITRFFEGISPAGIDFVRGLVMGKKPKFTSPGQQPIDFSYSNLNERIEEEPLLTDADLTDEERIRYGQLNAQSAMSIEDYLAQFGASTISRKAIRTDMLEPFKAKYGATDQQVREYVKLANRNTRDIARTIQYLNYEYKLSQPNPDIDDIAAEMSLLFGQNITPETIDAIIQGQGGKISYQTAGMKRRNEDPIEITDRESLLQAYVARLNLLNTHGAFDRGHVYAADQILKDNKVSNASMFRNLEPEIRASIQQLVSDVELEQLINGQLTKGTDYIDVIIGNRSKQAAGDPADKIFERLYGNAYGLEEDFKNFLFPNQNLANMIHPDLKPLFGKVYTNLVKQKVKDREGAGSGPKLKVGSHALNIIRLEAMQEVLKDYVAGTEITEEEKKAQESLAKVKVFLDFVTQKDMVNKKGEAERGDE